MNYYNQKEKEERWTLKEMPDLLSIGSAVRIKITPLMKSLVLNKNSSSKKIDSICSKIDNLIEEEIVNRTETIRTIRL